MKLFVFLPAFLLGLPFNAANAIDCVDTGVPGDGWGWDGMDSCRIDIPAGECVDLDGDGWGWDGVDSCTTDVQSNSNNVVFAVPPTGQTISYTNGDDADQRTTPISTTRFADNANGTFTDELSGLTWLGVRQCIFDQTWSSAINFTNQLAEGSGMCAELNDGSVVGEWRLPNVNELQSLVDYQRQSPAFATGIPYTGTWDDFPWGRYWSSTSFVADPNQNAWIVSSGFGQVSVYGKENVARAFAVRD